MSAEQNKAVARRWFDDVCNGRNKAAAHEIFAANHRYQDPSSPGVPDGPDGMASLASVYYSAFGDARWKIHEMLATDDTVVTRWTGGGTQTGELNGIPATSKTVSVQGIHYMKFRDGKIAESYNVWDTLGMLQQLGVVPQLAAK